MSNKEQSLEMTSGVKDSLLGNSGPHFSQDKCNLSAEQLANITDMDGRWEAEKGRPEKVSSLEIQKYGYVEGIARQLQTDLKTGINGSKADLQARTEAFGQNSFPPPKIKTIMELIMENFEDKINQILAIAAVVSIIIGLVQHGFPEGLIEGTSILIALSIIIVVNSGNNYMAERRLANLLELSEKTSCAVFRGSSEAITIDSQELVVGDLVQIEKGKKCPADMIMVSGQDVNTSEADLTGEPDACPKKAIREDNLQDISVMFAKSMIVDGTGLAIVVAVGTRTASGAIEEANTKEQEPTHLQKKLANIADKIGNVGIGCALLTFISMVIRTGFEMGGIIPCGCGNIMTCHKPLPGTCTVPNFEFNMQKNPLWSELLNTIIIAITVVVVAIPEGLPLAVTISLSFASKKMQKENNLVRTLSSAETMGGATYICSDKTGTLTKNEMTVMAIMAQNKIYEMGNEISDKLVKNTKAALEEIGFWQTLLEGIMWNSSARIEQNQDKESQKTEPYVLNGNVTEQGIIKFFMGALSGQDLINIRNSLSEENSLELIDFSSSRKRASIVVRQQGREGQSDEVRIYCKGAPDMIFDFTTNIVNANGQVVGFDDPADDQDIQQLQGQLSSGATNRDFYNATIKKFARKAYRTILCTYRDMSMSEFEQIKAANNDFEKEADREALETNLTAYGIFALQDPLRDTIKSSIKKCRQAGITTIMCTGDNIDTATAISLEAGIVTQQEIDASEDSQKYSCMTGKDFRTLVEGLKDLPIGDGKYRKAVANMSMFNKIKPHLKVLARSSPTDKLILVTGHQDSGGVVAVTGDGTNDAPALTKADVGFAMGITGTDVAKGACDIILLDDNFSSIITALRFGRNVFDNVRKFLQFQLTVNVVAMFIVFFGSVIIKDSPLNAVQMLWVNLIMDTFAALALATEPPAYDILERQPYGKDDSIMTEVMWRNVFGHAIYQIIVLIVVIFIGQGWLVANYTDECFNYAKTQLTPPVYEYNACDLKQDFTKPTTIYNPFYAKGLYYYSETIEEWKAIQVNGKQLTQASFDQALLKKFSCEVYNQNTIDNTKTCDELYKDSEWATKNTLTPLDINNGGVGTQKLLLFTFVFQIFVFMQLFNQFNARLLLEGEFNILSGIFRNWIFIFISIVTVVVQIAMVEVGGQITKCYALNTDQNMICLIFGSFEILWGVFIKFLPLKLFQCISLDESPIDDDQAPGLVGKLKASTVKRRSEKMTKDLGVGLKNMIAQKQREQAEQNLAIN